MDHASTIECAASAPPKLRAKASNNIFAFPGNGRTAAARRFRDLVVGLLRDLGVTEGALADSLKLQVRNTALLAVQVEMDQARAMQGEDVDMAVLCKAQNSLNRCLWSLGLGRRRRPDLTPSDALQAAETMQQGGRD